MNTQPEALLYNFNDPERLRQIRRYLNRQKVKTRIVTAPEFLHPLGYLFEIPGFHPSSQFNLHRWMIFLLFSVKTRSRLLH